MVSILGGEEVTPQLLFQLQSRVAVQWGEVDPFSGKHAQIVVPTPLVAVDDQQFVGGLAFTSANKPDSREIGVWINVLLVEDNYQHQGIGSQLVQAAQTQAVELGLSELYVFTEIPSLYEKQGWELIHLPTQCTAENVLCKRF